MKTQELNPADVEMIDVTHNIISELAEDYILPGSMTEKHKAWFIDKILGYAIDQLGTETTTTKLVQWMDEYFNL
jgi:hypothetical protein